MYFFIIKFIFNQMRRRQLGLFKLGIVEGGEKMMTTKKKPIIIIKNNSNSAS